MPLNDRDRREIDELIAQKLDLVSAFRDLPEDAREQIAEDIERYLYSRQPHLRKPENFYTPRITISDQDINTNESGVLKGHAGPTLPRWINFIGGSGTLDNEDFAKVNISVGAGADCMFDYLVSSCFASLAGFSEGQTFTSLSGCTFRGYSTIQGAVTAAGALGASDSSTVFVCRGTYAEQVVAAQGNNSALRIIGSGQGNTTIQPTNAMSGIALDLDNIASDAGIIEVEGITVDTTVMSGAGVGIRFLSPSRARVQNCRVVGVSGDTGVQATSASSTVGIWFDNVNFSGSITGASLGDTCTGHFINCAFESSTIGISVSHNAQGSAEHCLFATNTVGVSFVAGSPRNFIVKGSTFFNCTDGILGTSSSGYPHSIGIDDNQFISCTDAIDFSGLVGDCEGVGIRGNVFTDTGTNVGIRLHSTRFKNSLITDNIFNGGPGDSFTSGNEIVGMTAAQAATANTQIAHNVTDSGATLPDTHLLLSSLDHQHTGTGDGGGTIQPDVLKLPVPTTLTIASGAITATQSQHYIDGEGGLDDVLDTINGGVDGFVLVLHYGANGKIEISDTGNIAAAGDGTFLSLGDNIQEIWLKYDAVSSTWWIQNDSYSDHIQNFDVSGTVGIDTDGVIAINAESTSVAEVTANQFRVLTGAHTEVETLNANEEVTLEKNINIAGTFQFGVLTAKTISSDQIAVAVTDSSYITLAGQAGAADDLDGITGGAQGQVLVLSAVSDSVTITIKHNNAGGSSGAKIFTASGSDIVLDDIHDCVAFIYKTALDSGNGGWMQIADPATYTADAAHVAAADPHTGYILESLLDAKGDLISASADNTPAKLTVGANDTILMADSGQTTGLKWAAAATTTEIADIATSESAGTSDTYARGDHVHAAPHSGISTTGLKASLMLMAAAGKATTAVTGCAAPAVIDSGSENVEYWAAAFDQTTQEHIFWNIIMPENWDASTLTAKFYWTALAGGASESVRWGIAMMAAGEGDPLNTAFGTAVEVQDDWTVDGDVHISDETSAITPSGTGAAGDYMTIRVYRDTGDSGDDLTDDAYLIGVRLEYGITALSA